MNKLLLLFILFGFFSCIESEIQELESQPSLPSLPSGQQDIVTDIYGTQYPTLDPSVIYCGSGWGIKMCHFLNKYNETVWADAENYYSEFSDIKFSNFSDNQYFISFFNFDSVASYCDGWKKGETTYNGVKWNVEIIKDEEDVLWIDYDYYGTGEQIESTVTYKYEVVNGLLHFLSTDGQTFIFHPSQRNYSEDLVETDEIITTIGCLYY